MNTIRDWIQLLLYLGILLVTTKPLGFYMKRVFDGETTFLSPIFGPVERFFYRAIRARPNEDQLWTHYAIDLLMFSAVTFVVTFLALRLQHILPLNPQNQGPLSWHLLFNTTTSFVTNTNWQSYSGESTLSYFSQMVGLTLQNFISAGVGMAVSVALIRGIDRKQSTGIGNFWTDFIRGTIYILVPFSFVFAIILISQGVIQNFLPYVSVTTLEGSKQLIPQGPVASQVAIKMLGTNGGGFFGANAAHPFENPTPLSNFLQMLSIFLIPSGLVYLLGVTVKNTKHSWSVWTAMALVFVVGSIICTHFEYKGNPALANLGSISTLNMEGKETRFGIFNSALFATITTDASCGAVNAMHGSFTPLGGLVPLINMLLGEIIFGGVGAGLYGMIVFIVLTVFIAGLMVGRTPQYLGNKLEGKDIKCVMLAIIVPALLILVFSAVASVSRTALAALGNASSRGFTEVLYAYSSASQNNGSAFAGLNTNNVYWNITMAIAMFFGRFFVIIPVLALAGSLSAKKNTPESEASFPVQGPVFIVLLIGTIIIVGALTFFPALTLGPIAEHFQLISH